MVPDPVVGRIEAALEAGARDEAVETLLVEAIGMPAEEVASMRGSPFWRLLAANPQAFAPELAAGRRYRFDPAAFRDLATPTLLLTGALSPPFLRPVTDAVAGAIPGARIRVLDGQGHGAMTTAPAPVADIISDFADEVG